MSTATAPRPEVELADRLQNDTAYYAHNCLRIVDEHAEEVRFAFKPVQYRIDEALNRQRDEGRPERAIVLKARKGGVSTYTAGRITRRYTLRRNHKAVVVAHDKKTAGELFDISMFMYANLPDEVVGGLALKPPVVSSQRQTLIQLGQPGRKARLAGDLGLNSSLLVDTAGEVEAGRGFTYFSMHLSEVAFYTDLRKLSALLNAVPDKPGTLIVQESTANGHNHFRKSWVAAWNGESDYAPIFMPWMEEPGYFRPFSSDQEREQFAAKVGDGPYGEAEPDLIEKFGCTLEQLHWRRAAIINKCNGDLRTFQQEYPSTWEEAFLSTGRQVFSPILVSEALAECTEPRDRGVLRPGERKLEDRGGKTIEVPGKPLWLPEESANLNLTTPRWKLWGTLEERTAEAGRKLYTPPADDLYVVSVDTASGEPSESGELAYHAIEVIDHRTRKQVAEFRTRALDQDQLADQAYLTALFFNDAWLAVEVTGGWGLPVAKQIWMRYRYPFLYFRKAEERRNEKQLDRIGWDTQTGTKQLLEANMAEMLREGSHGIRSTVLAGEYVTYVRDDKGRSGPDSDAFADCLMAYMIAQYVANEKPLRLPSKGPVTTSTRPVRSRHTGY